MGKLLALVLINSLVLICLPFVVIRSIYYILFNQTKAWGILLAFDRVGNIALNGNPNETISSRAYRGTLENKKSWCILCKVLNYIEKDHCKNAEGI